MKKVLAMILVICLAMAVAVGATVAYLTAEDSATNTFTVGNVKIDLTEEQWDKVGKAEAAEVYGGEALAKDPTVTNTGKNPCFVRIKVTGLDCLGKDEMMIQYRTNYVLGALGEGWVEYDGYFYYEGVLEAGAKTTALFDSIVIPVGVTNDMGEFNIVVDAYAVQAQGARPSFTAVKEMKAADIAAWFAVCAPADWQ